MTHSLLDWSGPMALASETPDQDRHSKGIEDGNHQGKNA